MSASPGAGARSPLTPSKRQTSPPASGRRKRFSPAKLLRRLSSSKSCGDDADLDGSARARLTMPFTHARRALSLGGRWTAVDGTVIVGTKPSALLGDPRRLAAMGVTGVVNLCAEFRGPETAYRRLAIEHLRLPTSDHVEPAAEVLDAAVAFIRKHERAGGRVYVHCKALCGNQPVRRVH